MRYFSVFSMLLILCSCESKTIQSGFDFDLNADAYADAKRIPERAETRREAAFGSFVERTNIANYLLDGPLKDNISVKVAAVEAKNKIAIDTYLAEFVETKISEEQLRELYETNKADYVIGTYHPSHILIRVPSTGDEAAAESAFASAEEVLEKIAQGKEFSALVREYSDDKSTIDTGGKLPPISTQNGDPAIIEALANLSEGEVSKPIRTRLGVQIFRLDVKQEEPIEYEQVKDKIAYQLRQELKESELARLRELARENRS